MNGYEYDQVTLKIDSNKYTSDLVKDLGKAQEELIQNGRLSTVQSFDSHEERMRNMIRARLGDPSDPTDLAKSMWTDQENLNRSKESFGKGSVKEIEDFLIEQMRGKYDKTVTSKFLPQRGSSASSDKNKRPTLQLMVNQEGTPIRPMEGPALNSFGFSLDKPISLGVGNKERKFNTIYLDDQGNIVVKGRQKNFKAPTSGKASVLSTARGEDLPAFSDTYLQTDEEINAVARQLGFNNARELSFHLQGLLPEGASIGQQQQPQENKDPLGIL